jgi:hypothetical protein
MNWNKETKTTARFIIDLSIPSSELICSIKRKNGWVMNLDFEQKVMRLVYPKWTQTTQDFEGIFMKRMHILTSYERSLTVFEVIQILRHCKFLSWLLSLIQKGILELIYELIKVNYRNHLMLRWSTIITRNQNLIDKMTI